MTNDHIRGGDAPVRPFVTTTVARVSPDATLAEVAEKLHAVEVGALVVGASTETVEGIISERDIIHAIGKGCNPNLTRARDVATTEFIWGRPTETVREIAGYMLENDIRHVLIAERDELIGIVSSRDLLAAFLQEVSRS